MGAHTEQAEEWFRDYSEDLRLAVCCVISGIPCVQKDGQFTHMSSKELEDAADWIDGEGGLSKDRAEDELFDKYCSARARPGSSRRAALRLLERYVLEVEIDFAQYMIKEGLDDAGDEEYFQTELKNMKARLASLEG